MRIHGEQYMMIDIIHNTKSNNARALLRGRVALLGELRQGLLVALVGCGRGCLCLWIREIHMHTSQWTCTFNIADEWMADAYAHASTCVPFWTFSALTAKSPILLVSVKGGGEIRVWWMRMHRHHHHRRRGRRRTIVAVLVLRGLEVLYLCKGGGIQGVFCVVYGWGFSDTSYCAHIYTTQHIRACGGRA